MVFKGEGGKGIWSFKKPFIAFTDESFWCLMKFKTDCTVSPIPKFGNDMPRLSVWGFSTTTACGSFGLSFEPDLAGEGDSEEERNWEPFGSHRLILCRNPKLCSVNNCPGSSEVGGDSGDSNVISSSRSCS